MARLWTFAAGQNTLTAGVEFTSGNGSAANTISAFPSDAGRVAVRCNPSAASAWFGQIFKASASSTQAWVRTVLEVGTLPAAATEFVGLWASGAGTRQASCYIDNSGIVYLRDSTANNRVTSSALSAGIHVIEFTTTVSATVAAMELVIDGVSIGTYASGNVGNYDAAYWGTPSGAGTYDLYLSEFAINDSSGSTQTAFPSTKNPTRALSTRIAYIRANAAGDNNAWLKQGGGAGSSTNYQDSDEVTPDDATTYVKRTSTGAKVDDYNLPTAASVGIGSSDAITLIQVGARVGSTSTTATGRNYATRIKSQASGTVQTGSTATCNVNGWVTHSQALPRNYQLTSYTDPQAGGAWTPALIDTAQIGFTTVTSSANEIRVTTVWAIVEYRVAGAALAPSPVTIPIATPAPTISRTYALAPSPQTIPLVLPAPTITISSGYALTPSPVAVPIATPAPTISKTYALTPSPVAVPITTPAPTIGLGAYALTPSPVAVPLVIPDPTIQVDRTLAPSPQAVTLNLPAPTVSRTYALTPAPVAVPLVTPDPTITITGAGTNLAPAPVAIPLVVPAPTVALSLALTPDPVAVPLVIPDPTITQVTNIALTPDPVAVILVIPQPTITVAGGTPVVVVGTGAGFVSPAAKRREPEMPPEWRRIRIRPLPVVVNVSEIRYAQDVEDLLLVGAL